MNEQPYPRFQTTLGLFMSLLFSIPFLVWGADVAAQQAPFPERAVEALLQVERFGQGNAEAGRAWPKVAAISPAQLPELLAAFDRSNPLSANWLRLAGEAVVDRADQQNEPLPLDALREFLLDAEHAPAGRRFAYELLLRETPEAKTELAEKLLRDPSGVLRRDPIGRLILEGERYVDAGQKDQAIAVYRRALDFAVDFDQLTTIIGRLEKLDLELDVPNEYGFVLDWSVLGPFDNTDEQGFDVVYPPEKELKNQRLSQEDLPEKKYDGKEDQIAWQEHHTGDRLGVVDFNELFGKQKNVCGYALADFHSEKRQPATLRLSSLNALKIWFNGELVREIDVYHGGQKADQYIVPVTLEPGNNTILVKVCQNDQPQSWAESWNFSLRVCDRSGRPLRSSSSEER